MLVYRRVINLKSSSCSMYPRSCRTMSKFPIISTAPKIGTFLGETLQNDKWANIPCPMGHLGKEQSNDRVSVLDHGHMYSIK